MGKCAAVFFVCAVLFSQNYRWPTDASYSLTSSFAEPRANRFHAGIDITTWNREGYNCFAIADGYIYRIWTQPYGYGRALYVKLNDGNIAVYAHLQRFSEKIENYIQRVQKRTGKYNQNIYLKKGQIPVKKGEVIAKTGSTGIGSPHLHFEIRENMNTNAHTLSFYPEFRDKIRPELRHLFATPLGRESVVNASVLPVDMPFRRVNDSTYVLEKPIVVTGKLALELEAIDRTLKYSVPTRFDFIEVFLDSTRIFYNHFSKTTYTENHYLNLDYSLFQKKIFNRKVKRLFLHPNNKLRRFYETKNNGVVEEKLVGKKHATLEIRIRDFRQNAIRILGEVEFIDTQLIDFETEFPLPHLFDSIPIALGGRVASSNSELHLKRDTVFSSVRWLPNQENTFADSLFNYTLPKNSLPDAANVFSTRLEAAAFDENYAYADGIWLLQPVDMFFDKRLRVQTRRPLKRSEGVYEWSRFRKKWSFVRTTLNLDSTRSFQARSVDIYTILDDTTSPSIRFLKRGAEQTIVRIKDNLSGIRDEKNYTVTWNGKKLIAEYDYEEHLLRLKSADIRGSGTLKVICADNVGNSASRQFQL